MKKIIVIGGGPAGMAAAYAAKTSGIEKVILIERHDFLGGVLPQCIHNGFGTQIYSKDYTGGEYAGVWRDKIKSADIDVRLGTTVLSIKKSSTQGSKNVEDFGKKEWDVDCVSVSRGRETLTADALIIATGCREKTLPRLGITGSRPSGIFTAGSAQQMMNLQNYLPGKTAVILGSGDIGLIMARRMTLEGVKIKLILGEKSTGLPRNIVQCVDDYGIPMRYGWTVVSTHGYRRLKGVNIAPFDDDGNINLSEKEYIPCDTLLIAAGLIPETDICNDYTAENDDGLFICGNAKFVHDLVDNVTEEAVNTGLKAAKHVRNDVKITEELAKIQKNKISEERMRKEGNMICTVCPKGCIMQVELAPFSVTGNECEKGIAFAEQEIIKPKRIVTTIVKAEGGKYPVLSVKTNKAVDKKNIFRIIEEAKKIKCHAPVHIGETIAKNVDSLGVDLIATNQL